MNLAPESIPRPFLRDHYMHKGSFISLTDDAYQYLSTFNQPAFYLSLTGTGCSGFQHTLEEFSLETHDLFYVVVDHIEGLRFYIPATIAPKISGLEIDYVSDLLEKRIVFNNPNACGKCGCGNSVSF